MRKKYEGYCIDLMSSQTFVEWFGKQFTNFSADKIDKAGFDFMHQLTYMQCGDEELITDYDYIDNCVATGNWYAPYEDWWEFIDAISAELNDDIRAYLFTDEQMQELYDAMQ